MTYLPWVGHDPALSACTDYVVEADIGELSPGHRLTVGGVCLDRDGDRLFYAWTPGPTELMGEDSGVWLTVEHGADVPAADSSSTGSYSTDGGEFSDGEIGYALPPASARQLWFDFYAAADDDHRACRLTIDLAARQAQVER